MMSRLKSYSSLLVLLFVALVSCKEENIVCYSYASVPFAWEKGEPAVVSLPDSMDLGEYRWDIEVRNTAAYPYRDLWLEMDVESYREGRQSVYSRTLHLNLTDSLGRWHDEGTIGTYFISVFPQENAFVVADSTYNYQVSFRHLMEDRHLPGISDIGIKLKKK